MTLGSYKDHKIEVAKMAGERSSHTHNGHNRDGHSHSGAAGHEHGSGANKRALAVVLSFTMTYMVAEIVGGLITGSLALLADAAHMDSDNVALALALFAVWLS